MERAALVYQAGIANVFEVDCFNLAPFGREARRLMQYDFKSCEWFARGLVEAGVKVYSCYCNEAGDIKDRKWRENLNEAPFHEEMRPVFSPDVGSLMVAIYGES